MAQLDDFPNELLLNIAHQLADDSRPTLFRFHDLCSFTLASRKDRGIVQEALHHSVVIRAPVTKPNARGGNNIEPLDPSAYRFVVSHTTGAPRSGVQGLESANIRLVWNNNTHN
jgi:hypothetical protein